MSQQFRVELDGDDDFMYRLPNEVDKFGQPIPHRKDVTGTDREGTARLMSVIGMMPTVVHGSVGRDPHTLVIFEWSMVPERQDLRFKEVTIEVSFSANGPRGAAEDEAKHRMKTQGLALSHYDPEVAGFVPRGANYYNRTRHVEGAKYKGELGFSAGFAPYLSVAPKFEMERDTRVTVTKSTTVSGQPFVRAGSGARSRANGVRWTLLENPSQRSGVPAYMRSAVLLKRQRRDDGVFLGHIKIETHVSRMEDLKEKLRKLKGEIKLDHPLYFDPKTPTEPSAFEGAKASLDKVDLLAEYRIVTLEPLPAEPVKDGVESDEETLVAQAGVVEQAAE